MHVCSYCINSNSDHLCTLNIAQGENGHSQATKYLSRTILETASRLKEMTRTSTADISGLIQQIKSTASALSATNKVEKWTKKEKPPRIPAIIRHSHTIAVLRRVADELELSFEIQPTESCRRFLNLAHVNQRMRVDLLSITPKFDISGDMKVIQKLLPKMRRGCRASIIFVHLVIGNGGGPFSSEVQRQFASLSHLSNLKTAYISDILEETLTEDEEDNERMGLSFRGRSTSDLLPTLEYRGIRTVLYLEQYSESFERNSVQFGKWQELDRDTAEAEEDRERM